MNPTHIFCPSCQKLIKPATIPAIGTKVRCPYCKSPFTLEQKFLVERRDPTPAPATNSSTSAHVPMAQAAGAPTNTQSPYASIEAQQRGHSAPTPQRQHAPANSSHDSEPVAKWVWIVGGVGVAVLLLLAGVFAALLFMSPATPPPVFAKGDPDPALNEMLNELQNQINANQRAQDQFDQGVVNQPEHNAPAANPPAPNVNIPAIGNNADLKFNLRKGYKYEYKLEVTIGNLNGNQEPTTGNASYELEPLREARDNLTNQAFRGGQADGELKVRYSGYLLSHSSAPQDGRGTVSVSPEGNSIQADEGHDLSLISTSIGTLVFDQLPFNGANQWRSTRKRTINFGDERGDQFGRPQFGPPVRRRGGFVRPPMQDPRNRGGMSSLFGPMSGPITINDSIDYEVRKFDDNQLVVASKTTAQWTVEANGRVLSNSTGESEYTFDRKLQMIVAGHSAYKFVRDVNGIETSIPIHVAFKLENALTEQQVQKRSDDYKKKEAAELVSALELIKDENADKDTIYNALSKIASGFGYSNKITDAQRNNIAPHLNRWMMHPDSNVRSQAVRTTQECGTEVNIPTLLEVIESDKDYNRGQAIEALGGTGGNDKSAEILAKLFKSKDDRYHAKNALKKMPAYAERFVIPLLETNDSSERDDVLDILEEIGMQDSKAAIEKLQAKLGENDSSKYAMNRALEKIKERTAFQRKKR